MNPQALTVFVALVAFSDLTAPDPTSDSTTAPVAAPQVVSAPVVTPHAPVPPQDPPPPPATIPPAPHAQPLEQQPAGATAAAAALPAGQWVNTAQYGWLWLPYAAGYTHVVPDAALAYAYGYYPSYGWRWVVAPWVLGLGVSPYWGPLGPTGFGWYSMNYRVPMLRSGSGWVRSGGSFRGAGRGHR